MVIQFYGNQFFRIQFGSLVVAYNPISKASTSKSSRFGADIALSSFAHKDLNGFTQVTYGDKDPFVIDGPGEYEVQEVFIKGFSSKGEYAGEKGINTVYQMVLEGMNLLFLGVPSEPKLDSKTEEGIEDIDILFVPVNGKLTPSESYKLSVKLEPKVIVPMGFADVNDKNLKTFLKEGGVEGLKPEDKLTLKKKEVLENEGNIMLIKPSS